MFEQDSPLAYDTYQIAVKSRKVIMFPGWVSHSVQQNLSDKDRIGISFNYRVYYDNPDLIKGANKPPPSYQFIYIALSVTDVSIYFYSFIDLLIYRVIYLFIY